MDAGVNAVGAVREQSKGRAGTERKVVEKMAEVRPVMTAVG